MSLLNDLESARALVPFRQICKYAHAQKASAASAEASAPDFLRPLRPCFGTTLLMSHES
jgi:hypothetical protein